MADASFIDESMLDSSFQNIVVASESDSDPIKCKCPNTCATILCACKVLGRNCNATCECGTKRRCCSNNKPIPEGDDSDFDEEEETTSQPSKQRGKRSRNDDDDAAANEHEKRLADEDRLIQNFVNGLSKDRLKEVCTDLLKQNPGAYVDYVQGEEASTSSDPEPTPPLTTQPRWCKCGNCRPMPRDIENVCCKPKRGHTCITETGLFHRLCLDQMVLEIAMRVNDDLLAENPVRNRNNYRHQAYKTYIYWQFGRLGAGNRRVIPSCCVLKIRNTWPDPRGNYKGFIEGVGYLQD